MKKWRISRVLGVLVAFSAINVASAYEVHVEPKFLFNAVTAAVADPFYNSPEEAFVWIQAASFAELGNE